MILCNAKCVNPDCSINIYIGNVPADYYNNPIEDVSPTCENYIPELLIPGGEELDFAI